MKLLPCFQLLERFDLWLGLLVGSIESTGANGKRFVVGRRLHDEGGTVHVINTGRLRLRASVPSGLLHRGREPQ